MRWLFSNPANIDRTRVVAAIRTAEQKTSGEIRVLIARHRAKDPVAAAQKHFERLGMADTPERNAVLIFVAPRSRTFAVIGDQGVHEKCGDGFWQELAAAMTDDFKRGDFTYGLCHGVEKAGALLAEHFPGRAGRRPDEIDDVD
jgi:uncharacterized membrane protein